jgi:predicted AAA+ superfamily ATPase
MKGFEMQQLSISEIQRNLHKLDGVDIVEIIDKKRHKVKGYFLDSKYMSLIKELIKKEEESQNLTESLGGALHQYADVSYMGQEKDAWKQHIEEERGGEFGKAFEHFLLMEILAYGSYSGQDFKVNFWRTKTGLEIDFILAEGEIAIEIKGSSRIDKRDLKALMSFNEEYLPKRSFLVCNEKEKRLHGKIEIIPWSNFLQELWAGNIL